MRTVLAAIVFAIFAPSAFAETERELADRLTQALRSEWDRQDCMWRETLRLSDSTSGMSEDLKKIAGTVAYTCSQAIRARILKNMTPATELSQEEGVAYDQLAAQERALSIGRQLKELGKMGQGKAPQ